MNEREFKQHLKDLVHGRHRVEEHDWTEPGKTAKARTAAPSKKRAKKKR